MRRRERDAELESRREQGAAVIRWKRFRIVWRRSADVLRSPRRRVRNEWRFVGTDVPRQAGSD